MERQTIETRTHVLPIAPWGDKLYWHEVAITSVRIPGTGVWIGVNVTEVVGGRS